MASSAAFLVALSRVARSRAARFACAQTSATGCAVVAIATEGTGRYAGASTGTAELSSARTRPSASARPAAIAPPSAISV